jgi:hypothetical protein
MFIRVDFPEPDGPMIATSSLRPISRSIPRRAWTVSAAIGYDLVTSSSRMIVSGADSKVEVPSSRKGLKASAVRGPLALIRGGPSAASRRR